MLSNLVLRCPSLDTLKPEQLQKSLQHDHVLVSEEQEGFVSNVPKHVDQKLDLAWPCHKTPLDEIPTFATRLTACSPPGHEWLDDLFGLISPKSGSTQCP